MINLPHFAFPSYRVLRRFYVELFGGYINRFTLLALLHHMRIANEVVTPFLPHLKGKQKITHGGYSTVLAPPLTLSSNWVPYYV